MTKKLTTAEFIEKARQVHGDVYDYSNLKYSNSNTKVEIVCSKHGSFQQTPNNHLNGRGCPKCGREKSRRKQTMTYSDFVEKSRKTHGDKYGYSHTIYCGMLYKLIITCPIHGDFEQVAAAHIDGCGCPQCARERQFLSHDDFIARAREVHGDRYLYPQKYTSSRDKILIVCKKHGEFYQRADTHLAGHGCQQCAVETIQEKERDSVDDFIEKAHEVHGDKFGYNKVEYYNSITPVVITCPIHGDFLQKPDTHLRSLCGCPSCADERRIISGKLTTEEFITRAREVHGDRYDYSESSWENSETPIRIRCEIHGAFNQLPFVHLKGSGCPICGEIERHNNFMNTFSTERFINKAKEVHGDQYDYSKSEYVNNKTPLIVICKEHGKFEQMPYIHLQGKGCPKCGEKRRQKTVGERSIPEETLAKLLYEKFGEEQVKRHYSDDERYPFACDFYICSHDLFIELNAYWTHGGHWFDNNDPNDVERLDLMRSKHMSTYNSAIDTRTRRDPIKRKTAEENNLNYLVFWDNDLTDAKEWLATLPDK